MRPWSDIEILGAMFVIGPIHTLVYEGSHGMPTRFLPRRVNAVKDLARWFDEALEGIELEKLRTKKPATWPSWAKSKPLSYLAKKERELWLLSPVLPNNLDSKERVLKGLKRICRQIIENKEPPMDDWKKLDEFCRKFSDYLDKLRAQKLDGYPC